MVDSVFFFVFVIEMGFKMFAYGFFHNGDNGQSDSNILSFDGENDEYVGYFKDGWNVLDFFIVISRYCIVCS